MASVRARKPAKGDHARAHHQFKAQQGGQDPVVCDGREGLRGGPEVRADDDNEGTPGGRKRPGTVRHGENGGCGVACGEVPRGHSGVAVDADIVHGHAPPGHRSRMRLADNTRTELSASIQRPGTVTNTHKQTHRR